MSLAEIHGKLTPVEEGSEDFLTGEIFERLDLLGPDAWRAWLGAAQTGATPPRALRDSMPERSDPPHWELWRWFPPTFSGVPGCEPDLVLVWGDILLLVEMKFHSGLSGTGLAGEPGEASLADQLGRQWFAGMAHCLGRTAWRRLPPARDWAVIFITQHAVMPAADLRRSAKAVVELARNSGDIAGRIDEDAVSSRLYWVDYQRLHLEISGQLARWNVGEAGGLKGRIASRLLEILEFKGFRSFQGLPGIRPGPLSAFEFLRPERISWPAPAQSDFRPFEFRSDRPWICGRRHQEGHGRFYGG